MKDNEQRGKIPCDKNCNPPCEECREVPVRLPGAITAGSVIGTPKESPISTKSSTTAPTLTQMPSAHPVIDRNWCRRHMVNIKGAKQDNNAIPTAEAVLEGSTKRYFDLVNEIADAQKKRRGKKSGSVLHKVLVNKVKVNDFADTILTGSQQVLVNFILGVDEEGEALERSEQFVSSLLKSVQSGVTTGSAKSGSSANSPKDEFEQLIDEVIFNPALIPAAEGLRSTMHDDRHESVIAEVLDPIRGSINWASTGMPEKYKRTVATLKQFADTAEKIYRQSLPGVIKFLEGQNQKASEARILEASVALIVEQLSPLFVTLKYWTDAFGQRRDGLYRQLDDLIFAMEEIHVLFHTGKKTEEEQENRFNQMVYNVGNVFVARFSRAPGPATIPGARGPANSHALEVPHDEQALISFILVLYFHEFWHDYYSDVANLPAELTQKVLAHVKKAHDDKKLKFSKEKMFFGKDEYNTIDMILQVLADTMEENCSDAVAVATGGPPFSVVSNLMFASFNANGRRVSCDKMDALLRAYSFYKVNEKNELHVGVHMIDFARITTFVPAYLECLGFSEEAKEARHMGLQLGGKTTPREVLWADESGKRKAYILLSMVDMMRVAPFVAEAILKTKLDALHGQSITDRVCWNAEHQEKGNELTEAICQLSSTLPEGRNYHVTHVAYATINAYWKLCQTRMRPLDALNTASKYGIEMLRELRRRSEADAESLRHCAQPSQCKKECK
jgi:DNA-directed RNA polymerase subunit L